MRQIVYKYDLEPGRLEGTARDRRTRSQWVLTDAAKRAFRPRWLEYCAAVAVL